jgi:hypothetical protein
MVHHGQKIYLISLLPNQFWSKRSILNGKLCYGENLSDYKTDLRELNLEWVIKAYKNYKNPELDFSEKSVV